MTGVSTLGQALNQINRIKEQQSLVDVLSNQLSTGKKTQQFSGLEGSVLTSKRARAGVQALETYTNNITNAERRLNIMINTVQEFREQARDFLKVLGNLSQQSTHQLGEIVYYDDPLTAEVEQTPVGMTSSTGDVDLQSVIDYAGNIFDVFEDLLNVQDGERYLLGGAATSSRPINVTGTLDAAIGTLITDWKAGTISTTDLIADLQDRTTTSNPNAITDTTVGYSLELSAGTVGDVFIRVDESVEINYTTLANDSAFRDVIVAVSYMKNANLPPIADTYEPPNTPVAPFAPDVEGAPGATLQEMKDNFFAVVKSLTASVNAAVDQMDLLSFRLATAQTRILETKESHRQEQALLQEVIADVEDVDDNEVALKLSTAINQIEASYSVTARVQQLTLVNFL